MYISYNCWYPGPMFVCSDGRITPWRSLSTPGAQSSPVHCQRQLETIFQSSPHLLLPPSTFHHHTEEASDECNQSCGKLKLLTIFCNKSKVSAKFKHCKSYCSYMLTLSFFMIDIKYKIQIDSRLI